MEQKEEKEEIEIKEELLPSPPPLTQEQSSQTEEKVKDEDEIYEKTTFDTVVIAGGSLKGLFLLGSLQYCVDNFLLNDVKTYVGTSAGAMVCFLMAIGYTPVDIITQIISSQVIDKIQHFNIFAVINNLGATSFSFLSELLERMTIDKIGYYPTLLDVKTKLNKNLVFVTYNLTKDEPEYLCHETHPSLPCLVALRMSCNLPLIFDNYKYENNYYVDGGIIDNFPFQYAQTYSGSGHHILGIHMLYDHMTFDPSNNFLQYIFKIIRIPILQQQKSKIEAMKKSNHNNKKFTFIDIQDDSNENMFNFSISNIIKLNMFSSGYRQCKRKFER